MERFRNTEKRLVIISQFMAYSGSNIVDSTFEGQVKMKVRVVFLITAILAGGCDAQFEGTEKLVELGSPFKDRQIASIAENSLRADISINSGVIQSFVFPPGNRDNISVSIQGISLDQSNSISITWVEILNGFDIELSTQQQSFIAAGAISIDERHDTDLFDYDMDGRSNFDERQNDGCVWFVNTECREEGVLDVPPFTDTQPGPEPLPGLGGDVLIGPGLSMSGTVIGRDESVVDSILFDDDFTTDSNLWGTQASPLDIVNGRMCIPFRAGRPGIQATLVSNFGTFPIEPGTYLVEFDVVADRLAPVSVNVTVPPDARAVLDHYVQGTTEWVTHRIRFNTSATSNNGGVSFLAIEDDFETTYCFDNIRLFRLQ